MSNLKKTAVAVLAFGSSAVFAGSMGPVCTPGNVTVPCARDAWEIGAQALYLRPSYDAGLGFGAGATTGTGTFFGDRDRNWGWGFQIEGAYHFSTGNDIDINWYHFNRNGNNNDPFFFSGSGVDGDFRHEPRWDAVNVEFGQHVDFSEASKIRFHGGVQYSRVRTAMNNAFDLLGVGFDNNMTFNGFGPRVGADLMYGFGNGFAIYADAATAILAGHNSFNHDFFTGVTGVTGFSASGSKTHVVPEVDAKLGLKYGFAMAQGDLTIDAGWLFVNYFNAIHSLRTQNTFDLTGAITGTTLTMAQSNFALNGPYIGLKWMGNV